MSVKETKPPWADEPTPLCNEKLKSAYDETETRMLVVGAEVARDLERRLRHAMGILQECVTEEGALCWRTLDYAHKRIEHIDRVAREGLQNLKQETEEWAKIPNNLRGQMNRRRCATPKRQRADT